MDLCDIHGVPVGSAMNSAEPSAPSATTASAIPPGDSPSIKCKAKQLADRQTNASDISQPWRPNGVFADQSPGRINLRLEDMQGSNDQKKDDSTAERDAGRNA